MQKQIINLERQVKIQAEYVDTLECRIKIELMISQLYQINRMKKKKNIF